jgi:hypothetical protein
MDVGDEHDSHRNAPIEATITPWSSHNGA